MTRARVELFPCRRIGGWCALVWERTGVHEYVYRALFASTAERANMAAHGWLEQLRGEWRGEVWP